MINNLSESHQGNMPVRVLQHNLIYEFENMNPSFLELAQKVIAELGLDPGIHYGLGKVPVKSPHVVFNKMFIEESFLSYVWCMAFSLTVLYQEVIVKKSRNDYFGNDGETIDKELAHDAYKLWEYATSLLMEYKPWDKQLPNPELYNEKNDESIQKVNSLYLTAMKFILAHEFAHIELEHNNRIVLEEDLNAQSVVFEKEADARAIQLVLEGSEEGNSTTINMGILIGLCSLLFFSSITKSERYPDTDDRIDAIIQIINPDSQDAMWGVATLAYKLWDNLYKMDLVWQDGLESPKHLYESIKAQVENLSSE